MTAKCYKFIIVEISNGDKSKMEEFHECKAQGTKLLKRAVSQCNIQQPSKNRVYREKEVPTMSF